MADRDELLAANDAFYAALTRCNLKEMEAVWLHEPWVRCVHPGWDVLVGWDAIRASFQRIFDHSRFFEVVATEVSARAMGEIGIVTCSENITSSEDGDVGVGAAQATNLYRRTPDGWRMIVHHSSPAPVNVTAGFAGGVQ
jgi:ketosteroid isomerase-like protein